MLLDAGRRKVCDHWTPSNHMVVTTPMRWVLSDLFHQVTRLGSLAMIRYEMKVVHLGFSVSRTSGHKQVASAPLLQFALWLYGKFLRNT